jgi:hypothetical protein
LIVGIQVGEDSQHEKGGNTQSEKNKIKKFLLAKQDIMGCHIDNLQKNDAKRKINKIHE